jgi:hypothetical protein
MNQSFFDSASIIESKPTDSDIASLNPCPTHFKVASGAQTDTSTNSKNVAFFHPEPFPLPGVDPGDESPILEPWNRSIGPALNAKSL